MGNKKFKSDDELLNFYKQLSKFSICYIMLKF
jgi:hypothetical protein